VMGASAAYHLVRKNLRVLVIDKHFSGGATSQTAAGMLAAQDETAGPGAFFDLCAASRNYFSTLAPDVHTLTGIDPEWETRGLLPLVQTEEERADVRAKMDWQARAGFSVEWWERETVAANAPHLRGPHIGAAYFRQEGQINSGQWLKALVEAANIFGAEW